MSEGPEEIDVLFHRVTVLEAEVKGLSRFIDSANRLMLSFLREVEGQ